jgi:hypothetical protein
MRVWIDLSNSPHPLLFAPVAQEFARRGAEVGITFRDHAQTRELTVERFPDAEAIGSESPAARVKKGTALLARARALRGWAKRFRPDVAVSHNSYAQVLAARSIGVKIVTAMDYEHQPANHLAFRLADKVIVPEWLPRSALRRAGGSAPKTIRYPGFKEEIYLADFAPDPRVLDRIGIGDASALAVVRTPPSRAIYHRLENELLLPVVRHLADSGCACVVLPRHPEQAAALRGEGIRNLVVPGHAVDSRSLLCRAGVFVGAGGTMTREAALLGVPTYTIFAGRPAAVDIELERRGLVRRLTDPSQVDLPASPPQSGADLDHIRDQGARIIDVFVTTALELGRLNRSRRRAAIAD